MRRRSKVRSRTGASSHRKRSRNLSRLHSRIGSITRRITVARRMPCRPVWWDGRRNLICCFTNVSRRKGLLDRQRSSKRASKQASKRLAIHHGALLLADPVVELHRRGVGLSRVPIHALHTGALRVPINLLDQPAANAFSSGGLDSKQVLQITTRCLLNRASMKKKMRQAD